MPLPSARVVAQGQTPHAHEHDALKLIQAALPDHDPYQLWAFVELRASDGRLYEIDALLVTRHCLYLIEIKSWRGKVKSENGVDFRREVNGKSFLEANPYDLTNIKAKVLASMLDRKLGVRRPHVQALVFLAHPDCKIELPGMASSCIVGPKRLAEALTRATFVGAPPWLANRTIDGPLMRDTVKACKELGLVASKGRLKVGDLELRDVIEEGPGYQDRKAVHPTVAEMEKRVRLYLVPQAASEEHREQLRRAAEREARLLTVLGDHRYILKAPDYRLEGPHGGPCVVFEHFQDAVPLDVFLRREAGLTLTQRIDLIAQVGEALAYCHEKKVIHRGLHPGAVLVRMNPDGKLETRLYNFQLAAREGVSSGTAHHTLHTVRQAELYRAPELLENPSIQAPETDVFSLGALAWFVLVGRPPASDLAERQQILQAAQCLPLAAASDELAKGYDWRASLDGKAQAGLDDAIRAATDAKPVNRWNNVREWIDFLFDAVTRPTPDAAVDTDPLTARKGDELPGGFCVEQVLGTGSTARVLLVTRDGREYAMKVALDADNEDRLREEANALRQLGKRETIVELVETLTVSGRSAILMTHAGESLADFLARKGPPSLDLAARWGDDLLSALIVLEEEGVQHRDIKPANVGVGDTAAKEARHLAVFDFSLAGMAADKTTAGTPAYRDPFLIGRGRWDADADRYAAALTLHEMLTGVLPRYGKGDAPAFATVEDVTIESERFDSGVRRPLAAFFAKTLARDLAARHPDGEAMLRDWQLCFAEAGDAITQHGEDERQLQERRDAFNYAQLTADTPVDVLPLSVRARNALDRSGAHTIRELLGLSRNRLSFIRGVGRETRTAILQVIDRVHAAQPELRTADAEPFSRDWRGIDIGVAHVQGLSQEAAAALEDADLGRIGRLARAPKTRVERLLQPYPGARDVLARFLAGSGTAQFGGTPASTAPTTIESWLELLLPPGSTKRGEAPQRNVRVLFGLEAVGGRFADTAEHAARLLGMTRQAVWASLTQRKNHWTGIPGLDGVLDAVLAALDSLGGAAPLTRVAETLADHLPHADEITDATVRARSAQALIRLIAETAVGCVILWHRHGPWLARAAETGSIVKTLGKLADDFASREPLPASSVVLEAVSTVAKDTPLQATTRERLVRIAAWASDNAVASARLELYPRNMPAKRALKLCSGALSAAQIKPEELLGLVRARYAEAEPLPDRPALDALLADSGLTWNTADELWQRKQAPGETHSRTMPSTSTSRPRRSSQSPRQHPTPEERDTGDFDLGVRIALEQRSFKVLRVSAPQAEGLAGALQHRYGLVPVSLESLLLHYIRQVMVEHDVPESVVWTADRDGRDGPQWQNLTHLVGKAEERMLADLLQRKGILLLTRPGLLARYQLGGFFDAMHDAQRRRDDLGVLIIVPSRDDGHLVVDSPLGSLTVPALDAVHRLEVPKAWIRQHQPPVAA